MKASENESNIFITVEQLIEALKKEHPKQAVMLMDPMENAWPIANNLVYNYCYDEDDLPIACVFLKGLDEDESE